MHGLGNDFVVIDGINQVLNPPLPIKHLANRHLGIGFDQLLIIQPSHTADFACTIYNADGSIAEQCGNGLRCVGRFISENKLSTKKSFTIETKTRIATVTVENYETISVTMGKPSDIKEIELPLKNHPSIAMTLSMGNPHAILRVTDLASYPVDKIGAEIAALSIFPQGCNVGFMEIINDHHIELRTFERGVGETLSCGSNTCAAVVTGIIKHWLKRETVVSFKYGNLNIRWENDTSDVILTGPATTVFSGWIV